MFFKPGTGLCCATALPDNGMIKRFVCLAVPKYRGLALISNTDGRNGLGINAGMRHCQTDHLAQQMPIFHWASCSTQPGLG